MRSPDHDNTPSTHRTSVHHEQSINSANISYVHRRSGHSGQGHAAEVTLVVVAVDGALRARVPLQAAVRGPPPGVALYLGDEDVPVLGEGGAGPGEGQRVARVLREVNLIILRFVCWFTSLPLISRSLCE